jgi:predicted  nucleic acid-binding Zn-ribbon protein
VKASPEQQKELLRLQALDTRVQQLDHTQGALPQHVALAQLAPSVEAVRQRHTAKTGELEDARTELSRAESDVQVVEARMARDATRLQQTSSVKDIQALEAEVDALKKRRSDLEDIELAVMERIEGIEAELADITRERDDLAGKVAELEAAKGEEQAAIEKQRAAASADRTAIAGTISEDLLALYEKQRARYGVGAALLVRGVSMGSNVKLTESDLQGIRASAPDDVVLCPDSGAILVRNEESGL